jgi:KAP family P-loop domain/Pentapeptide repeats (8 copies)
MSEAEYNANDGTSSKNVDSNSGKSKLEIITDEPTSEGSLGFKKYSESLAHLIENSKPRFSIGIFGHWGTGKTTLMKMIMKNIEGKEAILPVWFSAWRYEREQYLALVPFIRTISIELENTKIKDRKWKIIKKGLERTFDAYVRATKLTLGPKAAGVGVETNLGDLMNSLKSEGSVWINDQLIRFHAHITDYLDKSLAEVRKKYHTEFKVVVFIDDLDRCTPEKALEVLESMKSFFDIKGIIFVVGMNYESIDSIIKAKYGEKSQVDGFEYMQKIVQLPFRIPSLHREDVSDFVKKIIKDNFSESLSESDLKIPFSDYNHLIVKAVKPTPREIKRFINSIILSRELYGSENVAESTAIQALHFRREWNNFLDFISDDDEIRHKFLNMYKHPKEGLLQEFPNFSSVYPNFFEQDDPLMAFLDAGAADLLNKPVNMRELRRTADPVVASEPQFDHIRQVGRPSPHIAKDISVQSSKSIDTDEYMLELLKKGTKDRAVHHEYYSTDELLEPLRIPDIEEFNRKREQSNYAYLDLTNVNLSGIDLTEADLRNANLRGADLSNSDLTRANLGEAEFDRNTKFKGTILKNNKNMTRKEKNRLEALHSLQNTTDRNNY